MRLRWFGHVMRRDDSKAMRIVMEIKLESKREDIIGRRKCGI